jgi:hypothetical protein
MGVGQLSGAGLRVKKVAGGTTTRYIFSGTKVIAEYANGSLSKEYINSGSKLLATLNGPRNFPGERTSFRPRARCE